MTRTSDPSTYTLTASGAEKFVRATQRTIAQWSGICENAQGYLPKQ